MNPQEATPADEQGDKDSRASGGGKSGQNAPELGDTKRTDENNNHKGGATGTGGPGGSGGSVL